MIVVDCVYLPSKEYLPNYFTADCENSYLDCNLVLIAKHKGYKLLPEYGSTQSLHEGRNRLCTFWKQEIHGGGEKGWQFHLLPFRMAIQQSGNRVVTEW